jgi:D-xylono/L-arabinono-1,4-lactonase
MKFMSAANWSFAMSEDLCTGLEVIADYACRIGENPLWHPSEEMLYWTDIPTGRMFRYDPRRKEHRQIYQGRPVGGFTFQSDGSLLLFRDHGSIVSWRDGKTEDLISEVAAEAGTRFNDVIADPMGRVFCGTMAGPRGKGRLYRLDLNRQLTIVLEQISCSNGMGFTPDGTGFYYTDSYAEEIYLFDYDIKDGSIGNRQVFATVSKTIGLPDGLTVDREGAVWSALWDGSAIVRFGRDGRIVQRIPMPTRKVTSLAFGGDDFTDLYITTAGGDSKTEDDPAAGALFRMRAPFSGVPEFFSQISIQADE